MAPKNFNMYIGCPLSILTIHTNMEFFHLSRIDVFSVAKTFMPLLAVITNAELMLLVRPMASTPATTARFAWRSGSRPM